LRLLVAGLTRTAIGTAGPGCVCRGRTEWPHSGRILAEPRTTGPPAVHQPSLSLQQADRESGRSALSDIFDEPAHDAWDATRQSLDFSGSVHSDTAATAGHSEADRGAFGGSDSADDTAQHGSDGLDARHGLGDAGPADDGVAVRRAADDPVVSVAQHGDGKEERTHASGRRVISFANGTSKELMPDGHTIVRFTNGDVKQVCWNRKHDGCETVAEVCADVPRPASRVLLCRSEHDAHHVRGRHAGVHVCQPPDRTPLYRRPQGGADSCCVSVLSLLRAWQIEFPDGTIKRINPNGDEESVFTDGTVQHNYAGGHCEVLFRNGQKACALRLRWRVCV
jgi:hypothetical protein